MLFYLLLSVAVAFWLTLVVSEYADNEQKCESLKERMSEDMPSNFAEELIYKVGCYRHVVFLVLFLTWPLVAALWIKDSIAPTLHRGREKGGNAKWR